MTTTESTRPDAAAGGPVTGIIDSDVHPNFKDGLRDLTQYMTTSWQTKLGIGGKADWSSRYAAASYVLPLDYLYINSAGAYRDDAVHDGQAPATDPVFSAKQLFDGHGIDRGILIAGQLFGIGAFPDPDVAATVASAYNDWMCEQWLAVDPRYRGALAVAPQDPDQAVKEIERVQGRPGSRRSSCRCTRSCTATATTTRSTRPPSATACRSWSTRAARRTSSRRRRGWRARRPTTSSGTPALAQIHQSNVLSLVCHGVFEKFPELKYVVCEGGFAWAAEIMWKLDRDRKGLGDEVPWLKKAPSDYIRRNIRFTTQPMVEPHRREHLKSLLEMVYAEETLLFSSDYPHWDFDDPKLALNGIDKDLLRLICHDNPMALYGDRL